MANAEKEGRFETISASLNAYRYGGFEYDEFGQIKGGLTWDSPLDLLGSGKYPSLHPSDSLSEKYQPNPSGLLLPKESQYRPDDWGSMFTTALYGGSYGLLGAFPAFKVTVAPRELAAPTEPLPVETRDMPVIGFRAWNARWDEGRLGEDRVVRLFSTAMDTAWSLDTNHATCAAGHPAPEASCGCGLYVLADLDQLESHVRASGHMVVGAVMGWGRVVQHGIEGWRAEYARPIALLDLRRDVNDKWAKRVSKEYRLPIMGRKALLLTVKEYGEELP